MDNDFDLKYADMVVNINSYEYYVNMMIAWYFATALAKQHEVVLTYIEEHRMPAWIHNKSIQKAIESRRIPQEHKEYVKSLKDYKLAANLDDDEVEDWLENNGRDGIRGQKIQGIIY